MYFCFIVWWDTLEPQNITNELKLQNFKSIWWGTHVTQIVSHLAPPLSVWPHYMSPFMLEYCRLDRTQYTFPRARKLLEAIWQLSLELQCLVWLPICWLPYRTRLLSSPLQFRSAFSLMRVSDWVSVGHLATDTEYCRSGRFGLILESGCIMGYVSMKVDSVFKKLKSKQV